MVTYMHPSFVSDVQYSCFLCCTKFLFSVLYKIPVFIDVQYSCFLWCTIFLKNGMMYLIPVCHVVPSSVVGKSVFSNFECCTIFWCIQVCVPSQTTPVLNEYCHETWLDIVYYITCTQVHWCMSHGCKFNSGCKFKILRVKKVPNDWLLLWNAWM